MLINFDLLDSAPPQCDVVIIGSGAAGMSMAFELIRQGLSVLMVEAGGFKSNHTELTENYRADLVKNHWPGEMYRRRVIGGTTTIWGGRCIPFESSDFDELFAGDGSRWPISYADIEPYIKFATEWLDAGESNFFANKDLVATENELSEIFEEFL